MPFNTSSQMCETKAFRRWKPKRHLAGNKVIHVCACVVCGWIGERTPHIQTSFQLNDFDLFAAQPNANITQRPINRFGLCHFCVGCCCIWCLCFDSISIIPRFFFDVMLLFWLKGTNKSSVIFAMVLLCKLHLFRYSLDKAFFFSLFHIFVLNVSHIFNIIIPSYSLFLILFTTTNRFLCFYFLFFHIKLNNSNDHEPTTNQHSPIIRLWFRLNMARNRLHGFWFCFSFFKHKLRNK